MKRAVLICGIVFLLGAREVRAGSVVTLAESPEFDGKLSLNGTAVHVDGLSPSDVNLPDILEADFSDAPFQLNYYATEPGRSGPMPMEWKLQDFGAASKAGSVTYADGALSLTGDGSGPTQTDNSCFFVGRPWTGDGQLTVRVAAVDDQTPTAEVGLMVRNGIDSTSADIRLGATAQLGPKGVGAMAFFRLVAPPGAAKKMHGERQPPVSVQLPVWLRLTQERGDVSAFVSSDGKQWDGVGHFRRKDWQTAWAGFFLNSHIPGSLGKAVLDQATFTPLPSSADYLGAGVLLRSGSFLAGSFEKLDIDAANPDAPGIFLRGGKQVQIPASKISAVMLGLTAKSDLAAQGTQAGLIMNNGDFLVGTPVSVSDNSIRMNSVLYGITAYDSTQARASILQATLYQPANYEIRLVDGSRIFANTIDGSANAVEIDDVSGVEVSAAPEEILQIRTGSAFAQDLLELPWNATAPSAAAILPAANLPAGTSAPAVVSSPVASFAGNNGEQIMMAPARTAVTFTLTSRFRSLAMRIALAPDAPANSQAVIRILSEGREIGRTPPLRAGEPPRFVELTLQTPKEITLVADSTFEGTKVLYIDPVVIR